MKQHAKPDLLPVSVLLLAVIGCLLRHRLYAVGLDEKGLLISGHPLELGLWLCTALAAAGSCLSAFRQRPAAPCPVLLSALGHILAAWGIVLTALSGSESAMEPLGSFWKYAGLAAAALLVYAALSLASGKQPFFGGYALASVFFALHLVGRYQSWCADPQQQNYFFAFSGAIGLMLLSYYRAAAAVGRISRRKLRLIGLMTGYLCLVSLSGPECLWLYLGCGLWAFTASDAPAAEAGTGAV